MRETMVDAGLSLDQAPPLSIPASFFVTAPLFVMTAGLVLAFVGGPALASGWSPQTVGVNHLGTYGFLAMVMMGALYQMTPVVAGAPVPGIRLAHMVHALAVVGGLGMLLFVWGLLPVAPHWPFSLMGVAFLFFVGPVGWALCRVDASHETVWGMRLSLACLLALTLMGFAMAQGWGGYGFPGPRALWVQVHLGIGFLGWVGCLIVSVSWQVVPMFYLTERPPERARQWTLVAILTSTLVLLASLLVGALGLVTEATWLAAAGTLPAALAVWVFHPLLTWRALSRRRRRRVDSSILFWRAGLVVAPFTLVAAVVTFLTDDPRTGLLLGWLAVWGWAGLIMHGMLTRMLPFLVWFHRFSHLVGLRPVPSLRKILPDAWTRQSLVVHVGSLLVGVAAIVSAHDVLIRATGVALLATAFLLIRSLVHVLKWRTPDTSTSSPPVGRL